MTSTSPFRGFKKRPIIFSDLSGLVISDMLSSVPGKLEERTFTLITFGSLWTLAETVPLKVMFPVSEMLTWSFTEAPNNCRITEALHSNFSGNAEKIRGFSGVNDFTGATVCAEREKEADCKIKTRNRSF